MRDEKTVMRTAAVIDFEGERIACFIGESLVAALAAAGIRALKISPKRAEPRGAFCMMGICQDCLVEVNGVRRNACLEPIADGMVVRRVAP